MHTFLPALERPTRRVGGDSNLEKRGCLLDVCCGQRGLCTCTRPIECRDGVVHPWEGLGSVTSVETWRLQHMLKVLAAGQPAIGKKLTFGISQLLVESLNGRRIVGLESCALSLQYLVRRRVQGAVPGSKEGAGCSTWFEGGYRVQYQV